MVVLHYKILYHNIHHSMLKLFLQICTEHFIPTFHHRSNHLPHTTFLHWSVVPPSRWISLPSTPPPPSPIINALLRWSGLQLQNQNAFPQNMPNLTHFPNISINTQKRLFFLHFFSSPSSLIFFPICHANYRQSTLVHAKEQGLLFKDNKTNSIYLTKSNRTNKLYSLNWVSVHNVFYIMLANMC